MVLLKHILNLGVWCLSAGLVTADTFSIKKCHCTSHDHLGYVTTHNWTSPSRSPHIWKKSRLYENWTSKCDRSYGYQCSRHNSTDCWNVRDVWCQPGFVYASEPFRIKDACTTLQDGTELCANAYVMQIDGKKHHLDGPYKLEIGLVYDCEEECEAEWPGKQMRSACTYKNKNKKSKFFGADVPSGFVLDKKGMPQDHDARRGGGSGVACQEYSYDYFEL